jgi:predicted histone-like DNA-binding protein
MAIKFKVIERGQPGVVGGGEKKFYALAQSQGQADIDVLTKDIEQMCTVSGADIRAVLYAMVDVIGKQLAQGRIVRLGELGSLRVSFSSEGRDRPQDVNATAIRNARFLFTPGNLLKTTLKTLKFQKA